MIRQQDETERFVCHHTVFKMTHRHVFICSFQESDSSCKFEHKSTLSDMVLIYLDKFNRIAGGNKSTSTLEILKTFSSKYGSIEIKK